MAHAGIGQFQRFSLGKLAYAVFAFCMGLVPGLLFNEAGILAAMAAHASFDTVFLLAVRPLMPRKAGEEATSHAAAG